MIKPRQKIIAELDRTPTTTDLYDQLKACLITRSPIDPRIDEWFSGIISSLYYRPNKLALILEGNVMLNNNFITNIMYNRELCTDCIDNMYCSLILDLSFDKYNLNYPSRANFTVTHGEYPCDKRLASYVDTKLSWVYPKRKDFIVIPVVEIDWKLFNSINKKKLWIEIFNKFKP
jgi:hypothetical protein